MGKGQAELIASYPSRCLTDPVHIVASDLDRAVGTARPLADRSGIEVQPDPRFRERSCRRWEQAAPDELERAEPALWARWQAGGDVLPDVGEESETALVARVVPAIEAVLAAISDDATLVPRDPMLALLSEHMQNACMTSITIRNVPDDVRDELAARARLSGRSLQEYLRSELAELARRPDPDVLIAGARRRTNRTGSQLSAKQILAHRDRDRT